MQGRGVHLKNGDSMEKDMGAGTECRRSQFLYFFLGSLFL